MHRSDDLNIAFWIGYNSKVGASAGYHHKAFCMPNQCQQPDMNLERKQKLKADICTLEKFNSRAIEVQAFAFSKETLSETVCTRSWSEINHEIKNGRKKNASKVRARLLFHNLWFANLWRACRPFLKLSNIEACCWEALVTDFSRDETRSYNNTLHWGIWIMNDDFPKKITFLRLSVKDVPAFPAIVTWWLAILTLMWLAPAV